MMIKTLNVTVSLLVGITVWFAALTMAVFLAVPAMHVLVIGGLMALHYWKLF